MKGSVLKDATKDKHPSEIGLFRGAVKKYLGEKVKVNSMAVYGDGGRGHMGFFLTDPTPLKKRLSV